ncbi:ERF family protein [Methanobacterium sp.]|uniref:ERF family protein n=1 Tax=Methanobacterium sp. TaxID=2164 RepID=UPI003C74BECA
MSKEIIKALVKVQKQLQNPSNTATNPFFRSKYAPLPDILKQVRPILSENGIVLLQDTGSCDGNVFIRTELIHTSGEKITSAKLILKPDKDTAQGIGSAITYGRRYQLTALLGISSEDDDGQEASKSTGKAQPKEDIPEDKEACGWIKALELELKNKKWVINDKAILSRAEFHEYSKEQIERIKAQLIKRSN